MNMLEEISRHLEWCGFGTVADDEADGTIFWGRMPESPDTCITVFCTDNGTGGPNSTARFQIMTRSRNTRTAYETAIEIGDALEDFNGFLYGEGTHAVIQVINCGAGLGADAKKRELYVTNISVQYCN